MLIKSVFANTVISILLFSSLSSCKKDNGGGSNPTPTPTPTIPATTIAVPLAGNAFITSLGSGGTEEINDSGLANWTTASTITSTYVRIGQAGQLHVAVKAKVAPAGNSSAIKVTVNGTAFTVALSGDASKVYFAGSVNIATPGYVKIDFQGLTNTGGYFADVSDIMIGGSATSANLIFANDPANYYWSRRGPSCHLKYTIPPTDKEYFYSELTVPAGEDKIGSYFMVNGFGEGYFGIQVNSSTERRILFSVWDPGSGQGLTTLVRKGTNVTGGRFGGEGTGGQSYLIYNWQAGVTYKFLTQGKPDGAGNTIYTSWFYAPEAGSWQLIASFTRPATSKYLTDFHGFVENFNPDQGYLGRKAIWSNQWVRTPAGTWAEITEVQFTVDATGANKQRMDFAGGVENGKFFLQNGGFFANNVAANTKFTKPATGISPIIDFSILP